MSDGVPANTALLVDAQQVAAASETIQLSHTNQAIVQMDTAPDSPPSAATNLVSLWQLNMTGLKAERFLGATKLTTTGVAASWQGRRCRLSDLRGHGHGPGLSPV